MKIIDNRSLGVSTPVPKTQNAPSSSISSSRSDGVDVLATKKSTGVVSAAALTIRAEQTALIGSERALGTISQLEETIRKQQPAPVMSLLKDSVLQVAASLQRSYPQYAQRLRNFNSNIDMLTSEITVIKRELSDSVKVQRQGIARTLIAEQNKDAAAKRSYNSQNASALSQNMDIKDAQSLYARRPNVSQLLEP